METEKQINKKSVRLLVLLETSKGVRQVMLTNRQKELILTVCADNKDNTIKVLDKETGITFEEKNYL